MMNDWQTLRQNMQDAFSHVPRPGFSNIPIIGCCDMHESDYDWYRHHTWQEFDEAIETRGFDPVDFITIHPLAFHYFTPGVIGAAIRRLVTDPDKYWFDESWIEHYIRIPVAEGRFLTDYLPLFDSRQRQMIAETLIWYKAWFLARHGWDYDEPDDENEPGEEKATITDSIRLFWNGEA